MTSEPIILFDIPSKPPCSPWSFNAWKTRFLLSYKGLDFKSEWVEYPDIPARLENRVTPRNGKIKYTIPAIKLPDGTYLMDSRKIADFMEEKHPEPPVYLDSPYLPKVMTLLNELLDPFLDLQLAAIPRCLLSEGSVEYWNTDRQTWVGMPLEQFEKQHDKEAAWKACGPIVQQITALLKENPDGAFFMGKTVSYADFVWGSFLIFARCIGDAELDGLLKVSGDAQAHRALMEGLRPWSERAKH